MASRASSRASSRVSSPKAIDWNTKARIAVEALYKKGAGNSFRVQKNGRPEVLVAKILSGKDIACVGIYDLLPSTAKIIIDTKDDLADKSRTFECKRNDPKFMQSIAKHILLHENSTNPAIFVMLSERGRITLQTIATGHFEWDKKMKAQFKLRSIFEDQERQKCRMNPEKKITGVAEKPKVESEGSLSTEEKKVDLSVQPKKEKVAVQPRKEDTKIEPKKEQTVVQPKKKKALS